MNQLVVHVAGRLFIKVTPAKRERGKTVTLSVTVEMEARFAW